MKEAISVLILLTLIAPSPALTDYQRGVLDGLNHGWVMAQKYDEAKIGNPVTYNQAVPIYNSWIAEIFGQNESLMLKPINAAGQSRQYSTSKTLSPIHAIDASWNQTSQVLPEPDAYGLIHGYPAETYYSVGPALYI